MKDYTFKTANMKKEQEFTLYPYKGGDTILLQSDKRIMQANLRTGQAIINATNRQGGAYFVHLSMEPLRCQLPEEIKIEIQAYLWHNEGEEGNINNCVHFENKELFSL